MGKAGDLACISFIWVTEVGGKKGGRGIDPDVFVVAEDPTGAAGGGSIACDTLVGAKEGTGSALLLGVVVGIMDVTGVGTLGAFTTLEEDD